MSLEEREHRSALRTVALLSGQVWEEIGEVSAALSALRAEAQSVAAQSHGSEAVEVGELLICFGRASALLDRQAAAVDTMADLLGDLGVSVPAETAEDA